MGQTLGHYDILSAIGAGAMGEVYLARDTRLDRQVALKVLPARFTRSSERVARFRREAKAASALNHPNIITIYDIGKIGDTWFIAAELIQGVTLRERLKALPFPRIIPGGNIALPAKSGSAIPRGARLNAAVPLPRSPRRIPRGG